MASRGRKPIPANLKLVTGARERRPKESFVEVKPDAKPLGPPPSYFSDELKSVWAELARAAPKGVLTSGDRMLVEQTAMVVMTMRKGWEENEFIPASLSGELRRCLADLHLTPSSRSKIVAPKDSGNPFEDL